MAKRIHIFRIGERTANSGEVLNFTAADAAAMVAAYDPNKMRASYVIGHPKDNDPSYGWPKSLCVEGDNIYAQESECVEPQFAELVNSGRLHSVSISLYRPGDKANPVPGVWYPRHIGFLGAMPPAVKGMERPSFAAGDEECLEFSDFSDSMVAGVFRRIRDFFIEKFSLDEADKVIPDYMIQSLEAEARAEISDAASPGFSEHEGQDDMTKEELAQREAALLAREQTLQAKEAQFAEAESTQAKAARHAEHVAFCEALVQSGQMLAVNKDRWVQFMDSLDVAGVVEFSETDKPTHIDFVKAQLKAMPKQVTFGEHESAGADVVTGTVSFAAPQGFTVDVEAVQRHEKALAFQKSNQGISYIDAVKAVSAT